MQKVAVFDLDGTLIDSKQLYINTIKNSLLEHYFIYPTSHISRALGPKLEITLSNIGKFNPKTLKLLKNKINKKVTNAANKLKPTPYARQTLQKLRKRGFKVILLTNSAKRFATAVLKKNKIREYFGQLYYSENFSNKEQAIKQIAKKYKIKVSDIIYIADRKGDVKIARNVGCRIFIVLARSWDKKMFHKEKYAIRSLKELKLN